jgi:hypothetical protein
VLLVYLFAALFGGVLLGYSLVGGADGAHDLGPGHGGGAGEGSGPGDQGASIGTGAGGAHGAGVLLSMRFLVHFLCFAGLTGLLLTWLGAASTLVTAALAVATGGGAGLIAQTMVRRAAAMAAVRGTVTREDLVGHEARVRVPFARGSTGSIRLEVRQSTLDVLAVCEDEDMGMNEAVVIVDFRDDCAVVTRDPGGRDPHGGNP